MIINVLNITILYYTLARARNNEFDFRLKIDKCETT